MKADGHCKGGHIRRQSTKRKRRGGALVEPDTIGKRQESTPENSRCLGAAWPGVAVSPASLSSLRTLACTTYPDAYDRNHDSHRGSQTQSNTAAYTS